jgi:hypothetical protein
MGDDQTRYFQFPLCALAFGQTETERLDTLISYSFAEAGFTMFARLNREIQKEKAESIKSRADTPADYRSTDRQHVAVMIGSQEIGVRPGSVLSALNRWQQLRQFRGAVESAHGRDVEARIEKGLAFEVRDRTGMSYREFAVLCAVYSAIGAKAYPVRIVRETIRCRALGYKSTSMMVAEIGKRTDGSKPLSLHQINYTLDRLHERQFFARARANERQTFYSNRLQQDQLEKALVEGKAYSQDFHQRRLQRDAALMAAIKGRKAIEVNRLLK